MTLPDTILLYTPTTIPTRAHDGLLFLGALGEEIPRRTSHPVLHVSLLLVYHPFTSEETLSSCHSDVHVASLPLLNHVPLFPEDIGPEHLISEFSTASFWQEHLGSWISI